MAVDKVTAKIFC